MKSSKLNAPLLLAIDQGTSSSRAILFNAKAQTVAQHQIALPLSYPNSGWVEQDAEQIWRDTLQCCQRVLAGAKRLEATVAIGIANQRETTVVWDKISGKPIYNAIVWQDRRTADDCQRLQAQGHETSVNEKTGLRLDPYFSATKIAWLLDHVDGARRQAEAGELLFGTIDSFLLWHLTDGKVHATDRSNASRTLLLNIHRGEWDDELLDLFDIPCSMLPKVFDNVADFGMTAAHILGSSIPIKAMIGDQQAALVGQACFQQGMVKSTYGTGCFMLMNTGHKAVRSTHRLLTTIAYSIEGECHYALEGSIFVAGAAIQWLRDGLALFEQASDTEALAQQLDDNQGVYFVPALTGLGAPYWRPDVRGAIVGLGLDTGSAHIARAALEAQAYQTRDLMTAMRSDTGITQSVMRVDGGLVVNQFVCQFLADILQTPIDVPAVTEATAWGAASLAGLGVGVFADLDGIAEQWQEQQHYAVHMSNQKADALYGGWQQVVQSLLSEKI